MDLRHQLNTITKALLNHNIGYKGGRTQPNCRQKRKISHYHLARIRPCPTQRMGNNPWPPASLKLPEDPGPSPSPLAQSKPQLPTQILRVSHSLCSAVAVLNQLELYPPYRVMQLYSHDLSCSFFFLFICFVICSTAFSLPSLRFTTKPLCNLFSQSTNDPACKLQCSVLLISMIPY